ncbi:MAG TPA: amidohydrolase family protein [Minicystis sp.]|nr:amidohydrolase family protein [Minicystis sp.]
MRRALLPLAAVVLAACADDPPPRAPEITSAPTAPAPPAAAAAPKETTLRYDVVLSGRVVGHAVLVRHADGAIDEDYAYADRGRGPKTHAHLELGDDGLPAHLEIAGKDYFHRDVHELATCAAGCTWDSNDEHGAGERAFFVPLNDTLVTWAPLLRAASKAGGVKLAGGGAADARKVAETTLTGKGSSLHVSAYELGGLWFTPVVRWFDDDGALFADVNEWGATVREGWEDARGRLLELQRPLGQARRERVAKAIAHRPAKLAIEHARLFDPATKRVALDQTIVIEDGKVKAVGAKLAAPKDAEVVDARGKTVLPGLWDMHVHLSDEDGLQDLAAGVTTVRDMGNAIEPLLARKARWDAGTEVGPHVLLAGLVDGRGEYQAPIGIFVDTPDEAKQAVAKLVEHGYAQLKIYSSTKPELVPVLAAEAHRRGLRVSGHVPAHMIAEDAVNAGYDEIQHVNFLMLDVLSTREDDTRTPFRFTRVGERAADLSLDDPRVKKLVDLLVKKRTVIDPTLYTFEAMFTEGASNPDPALAPILPRLPAQVRRGAFIGGIAPPGMEAKYKASFARCRELVKRLWDKKVPLVAGTDGTPGFGLHRELELYADAGIPNADVLAMATLGAAKVMHVDKTTGSIAPGKDADLVIVDGDPLARMRDVRNTVLVVKGGTVVDVPGALRALSIAPR